MLPHLSIHAFRARARVAFFVVCSLFVAPAFLHAQENAKSTAPDASAIATSAYIPSFAALTWTGQLYVGVTSDTIQTSADGVTWTVVHDASKEMAHSALGQGSIVVTAKDALLSARLDGNALKFTAHAIVDAPWNGIAFGGGRFVAIDAKGRAHVSDDATTWKSVSIASGFVPVEIAFGDGTWVAVGANGETASVYVTKDAAASWTRAELPADMGVVTSVVRFKDAFQILGSEGHVCTSRDGAKWQQSTPIEEPWQSEPTYFVVAGEHLYAIGGGVCRLEDNGAWTHLPRPESTYVSSPVVRDGQLFVVLDDDVDQRILLSIDEVVKRGLADAAANEEAVPPHFELKIDAPLRVTAFDGADVRRLAASADALYAATSKGLYTSIDGKTWTRFGDITKPVDFVAASAGFVVIGNSDGLSSASAIDGHFTPIQDGNFKVRDLRGVGGRFAAIGEGTKFFVGYGAADGWADLVMPSTTRIASLDVDTEGRAHLLAETAAGAQHTTYDSDGVTDEWTPLLHADSTRICAANGRVFALLDAASGAAYLEIGAADSPQRIDVPGRVTDAADTNLGTCLVTPQGLVLVTQGREATSLHSAEGANFTSVVDAGSSIVVGGRAGVIVIVPLPAELPKNARVFASTNVDVRPTVFAGLPGVRFEALNTVQGGEFERVRAIGDKIYAFNGQAIRTWSARDGWSTSGPQVFGLGAIQDFWVSDAKAIFVGDTSVATTSFAESNGSNTHWTYDVPLRRLFFGDGTWVAFSGANGVAASRDLGGLNPTKLAEDLELCDAAWGNGVWTFVGGRGESGRQAAVLVGKEAREARPIALPSRVSTLRALNFDGTRFVAVGDRGLVATSSNGLKWNARTIAGEPMLTEVAFGAGHVAVSTDAHAILVSQDLKTWRELPRDPRYAMTHLVGVADALWAIGPHGALEIRGPASAWTALAPRDTTEIDTSASIERVAKLTTSRIADGASLLDIAWDGMQFLAVSESSIWSSEDAREWKKLLSISASSSTKLRSAFGRMWLSDNAQLLSLTPSGSLAVERTSSSGDHVTDFAVHEDSLAFVTKNGDVTYTNDRGHTWQDTPRAGPDSLTNIVYGANRWLVIGTHAGDNATFAATSSDLKTWKQVAVPDHVGGFQKLFFGKDRFVGAGGREYAVFASTDGEHWEGRQIDDVNYGALAFDGERFLVARNEQIFASDDGLAWRDVGLSPRASINTVMAAFGQWFCVGGEYEGVNYARLPALSTAQFSAARPANTRPFAGFARALADWDLAMTRAASVDERERLCKQLCSAWRDLHPGYTREAALAFLEGMYDRVLSYETSDASVTSFVLGLCDFSQEFSKSFLDTLPAKHKELALLAIGDVAKDYDAKWTGVAPTHGARIQSSTKPATAQRSAAEMDVDLLRLRAARGESAAAYDLNYLYRIGEGVMVDVAAADYWLKRAEKGGFQLVSGPTETAESKFAALRKLAEQGSVVLACVVGRSLRDGTGTAINLDESVRWFRRSLDGGYWGAANELANALRSGKGTRADPVASLRLLEKYAALGHVRSMADVAWSYAAACGTPRDLATAADWYEKAVAAGHTPSMLRLADMLLAGRGRKIDAATARTLVQRAADLGDTRAKEVLASLTAGKYAPDAQYTFHPPRRLPAQFDIAARRAQAEVGDAAACYDLACACTNHWGIGPEEDKSLEWLEKAKAKGLKNPTEWATTEQSAASWKVLADQGSIVALTTLGQLHRDGLGVALDHAAANACFERAIAAGSWEARVELALQLRFGRGTKVDTTASRKLLEEAAALGHARALAELGWIHEAACGVKRDLARAAQCYQRAADLDQPWAIRRLAECYLSAQGVAKDEAKAKALLERALEGGDTEASKIQARLAAHRYTPPLLAQYTVPKPSRAIFDVAARRAQADAGDAAACYDMAYATWGAFGVEKDNALGDEWLAKAKAKGWKQPDKWATPEETTASWQAEAEQGSLVAMYQYAARLHRGEGTDADVATSTVWFTKAADLGNSDAMAELGLVFEFGRGTTLKDEAKSLAWYRRAADLGNAYAQEKMGYRFALGIGVKSDEVEATRYYQLAAEGGNTIAAANFAARLASGAGIAMDVQAAAGWYLEVAGLGNVPSEPVVAFTQLQDALAGGHVEALAPLAIQKKRAFGTTFDPVEAWALAHAANTFDVGVYPLSWFEDAKMSKPAALRRSAQIEIDCWTKGVQGMMKSDTEADLASGDMVALREKLFAEGKSADKSAVAAALRALEQGRATDAEIQTAVECTEPLRIAELASLWKASKTNTTTVNSPWTLRLAGVSSSSSDALAAEIAFAGEALDEAPENDAAGRKRSQSLREIQVARHYYGVGVKPDAAVALAWALFNERAMDSFFATTFLAEPLTSDELARADARYLGLLAERQRRVVDRVDSAASPEDWMDETAEYKTVLERAATAGDLPSLIASADHYATGAYNFAKDPALEFKSRLAAAQHGDVESMSRAGHALFFGTGTSVDTTEGKAWIAKAAALGHKVAADSLALLQKNEARAALRTAPDKQAGPVDDTVFEALKKLQNDAGSPTINEAALVNLLRAIWWDAEYSPIEEDLARELNSAAMRPLVVSASDGRTLSFTKTVDNAILAVFPQYLPGAFDIQAGEYYRQVWLQTLNVGVFLGGSRLNDNARQMTRHWLAESIFEGVKFAAKQGGVSYEQIFTALKSAHDAANPALQSEFRAEIHAAIALIEAEKNTVPDEWKNAAWLK